MKKGSKINPKFKKPLERGLKHWDKPNEALADRKALLRHQTGCYQNIIQETSTLGESIIINHGFVDKSKGAGFAVMHIFLDMNGFEITAFKKRQKISCTQMPMRALSTRI